MLWDEEVRIASNVPGAHEYTPAHTLTEYNKVNNKNAMGYDVKVTAKAI